MFLIVIGSKSLKGNGQRALFEFKDRESISPKQLEHFLDTVFKLSERHKRIRIFEAIRWGCPNCDILNYTKINEIRCPFCRKVCNELRADGRAYPKDFWKSGQIILREVNKANGKCGVCWNPLNQCTCTDKIPVQKPFPI